MTDSSWDIWLRLHRRFGRAITLVDLYELEAMRRGVSDLPHQIRADLTARWQSVSSPSLRRPSSTRARHDPVVVVDYDPSWPAHYLLWRDRLALALGPAALAIDHIGSTSVPGLAAKPVIDITVAVSDVEDEGAYLSAIESAGVAFHSREAQHRYFRPAPGLPRDVQVHVSEINGGWRRDHLAFRDYLRHHSATRDAYGTLKKDLAVRFHNDRVAYGQAKTEFILSVLALVE